VVYAMFGFMWLGRTRYPAFQTVLDRKTIQIFLIWLVGCFVATQLNIWRIGNAAHLSGLVFGMGVASCFKGGAGLRLRACALAGMVAGAVIPLYWSPWSVPWLSQKAYQAHASGQYPAAMDFYTRIIKLDSGNAWAYGNRALIHEALGDPITAKADAARSHELAPAGTATK
jgi:tetratricopeptide (TPR) repeat protein